MTTRPLNVRHDGVVTAALHPGGAGGTFPRDDELWQETSLAALVMCRVLDDLTDVRADALTGEISNFWLSGMSTHDKALYAACAIAMVKFGCVPEAHGEVWNAWLVPTTMAWMSLTGRHALWFDGIALNSPVAPERDCVLCGLYPTTGDGLWSGGLTLRSGPARARWRQR